MARKKDSFYFDSFVACAKLSSQAARLLAEVMRSYDPDTIGQRIDEMHAIEQAADEHKHEVLDALVTAFVTPIEREDIAALSDYLDTVVDRIEGVLLRLYFDNIRTIRPDALPLVEKIERSCDEMGTLLAELAQFKRSKTLREHVIAINSIEEEADSLYIEAMRTLLPRVLRRQRRACGRHRQQHRHEEQLAFRVRRCRPACPCGTVRFCAGLDIGRMDDVGACRRHLV